MLVIDRLIIAKCKNMLKKIKYLPPKKLNLVAMKNEEFKTELKDKTNEIMETNSEVYCSLGFG